MSERVLSEERPIAERPIDEGITTASLAGVEERTPVNDLHNGNDIRTGEEADAGRSDFNSSDFNTNEMNGGSRTARTTPATTSAVKKGSTAEEQVAPLFPGGEAAELHERWDAIQVGFVDEPRQAVEQADALVAGAMKRLAEIFAEERARLEGQWDRGDSVSTEDLRVALRRYRSFFGRVLAV